MKSLIVALLSFNSLAFHVLVEQCYPVDDIIINVSTAGDCSNTGRSSADLPGLVQEAVDKFWNRVSTSKISLVLGDNSTLDTGSLVSTSLAIAAAESNHILIGCNQDAFNDVTDIGVLGRGGLSCSGGNCQGGVLINNDAGARTSSLTDDQFIALLAHEIGHAIGLAHSRDGHSLMDDTINFTQEDLSIDDIDGITYLCPNEKEAFGLGGACGTINTDSDNGPSSGLMSFVFTLLAGVMITLVGIRSPRSLRKRSDFRPA